MSTQQTGHPAATDGGVVNNAGRSEDAAAPSVVAPVMRDLGDLAKALTGWLAPRIGAEGVTLANFDYPRGAGTSHETILFDAEWTRDGRSHRRGMVVRIKPMRYRVFLDDLFDEQYRLMDLMHRKAAVPIAAPLWFEPDPALLGAPFFVMEKVRGRVAVTFPPYSKVGWLFDAQPRERRVLWEDSVRKLAGIQTVATADADFLDPSRKFAEGFDQEIDKWARTLEWVDEHRELGLLRDAFDKLLAMKPANRAEGIVWGDARLGNMMVGDDFKVAAVMDWEQPSLGGALHDLGWWLLTERNQTVARGIEPLTGMGTREETIALWTETCGKSADEIEWYEAFAAFKMECLARRMVQAGSLPPEAAERMVFGSKTLEMLERS